MAEMRAVGFTEFECAAAATAGWRRAVAAAGSY
jgi:hypothetical protein